MEPLPHTYHAAVAIDAEAVDVIVRAPGLPELTTNAPAEYDGPGDHWSPETLLMAAVADCYVLGFRAIARASGLEWQDLGCQVSGTLDKVDKVVRFTRLEIRAQVRVSADALSRAERILTKAKETCLVTNSLACEVDFRGEPTAGD